jgi:hypothetical protein
MDHISLDGLLEALEDASTRQQITDAAIMAVQEDHDFIEYLNLDESDITDLGRLAELLRAWQLEAREDDMVPLVTVNDRAMSLLAIRALVTLAADLANTVCAPHGEVGSVLASKSMHLAMKIYQQMPPA